VVTLRDVFYEFFFSHHSILSLLHCIFLYSNLNYYVLKAFLLSLNTNGTKICIFSMICRCYLNLVWIHENSFTFFKSLSWFKKNPKNVQRNKFWDNYLKFKKLSKNCTETESPLKKKNFDLLQMLKPTPKSLF